MAYITLPYDFQAGKIADADKFLANLDVIKDEVNGNLNDSNIAYNAELTVNELTTEVSTPAIYCNNIVVKLPSADGSHKFQIKNKSGQEMLKVESNGNVSFHYRYVNKFHSIGTILMFSGAGWVNNSTLPGWYLCNGNNGTTNLVNKFIRGGATSGATGGSDNTPTVQHNHSNTVGNNSAVHTHIQSPLPFNVGNKTTNHNHSFTVSYGVVGGAYYVNGSNDTSVSMTRYTAYSAATAHNHACSGNTSNQDTSHTHTVTIESAGSSGTGKNMPSYYSLIFIQRKS